MANQESDHSRLETALRPHCEASAGGMGGGGTPEGWDTHANTHSQPSVEQQHKHAAPLAIPHPTQTKGTRPCLEAKGTDHVWRLG